MKKKSELQQMLAQVSNTVSASVYGIQIDVPFPAPIMIDPKLQSENESLKNQLALIQDQHIKAKKIIADFVATNQKLENMLNNSELKLKNVSDELEKYKKEFEIERTKEKESKAKLEKELQRLQKRLKTKAEANVTQKLEATIAQESEAHKNTKQQLQCTILAKNTAVENEARFKKELVEFQSKFESALQGKQVIQQKLDAVVAEIAKYKDENIKFKAEIDKQNAIIQNLKQEILTLKQQKKLDAEVVLSAKHKKNVLVQTDPVEEIFTADEIDDVNAETDHLPITNVAAAAAANQQTYAAVPNAYYQPVYFVQYPGYQAYGAQPIVSMPQGTVQYVAAMQQPMQTQPSMAYMPASYVETNQSQQSQYVAPQLPKPAGNTH